MSSTNLNHKSQPFLGMHVGVNLAMNFINVATGEVITLWLTKNFNKLFNNITMFCG